jgi:hypothetical protein
MRQHQFPFPSDFDISRIEFGTEIPSERIGIDPLYPNHVVRTAAVWSETIWEESRSQWVSVDRDPIAGQAALGKEAAAKECALADIEISLVRNGGTNVPSYSSHHLVTNLDGSAQIYTYVRRLYGDTFTPDNELHSGFVMPYCEAAIRYLGSKTIGDVVLYDAFLTRNFTVGSFFTAATQPDELYLHDLDPLVCAVTKSPASLAQYRVSPFGMDYRASLYQQTVADVISVLQGRHYLSREEEGQAATLLEQAETLWKA